MSRDRIAELDREIESLTGRMRQNETSGGPGFGERADALRLSREIAQHRIDNLRSGFAEDHGLGNAATLAATIEKRLAAIDARIEKRMAVLEARFAALEAGVFKGLKTVLDREMQGAGEALGRIVGELREAAQANSDGLMRYSGTYQRALAYPKGAAVTQSGQLYVAVRAVEVGEIPGMDDGWQLAVKKGRDARTERGSTDGRE